MQVSGTTVVAQSGLGLQNTLLGSGGQVLNVRVFCHKFLPVGQPLFNARLLEDDFAEPNGIGIAVYSPGQRSTMLVKPLD